MNIFCYSISINTVNNASSQWILSDGVCYIGVSLFYVDLFLLSCLLVLFFPLFFFLFFFFCGEGWGWTNFFDTSVVIIIVKAGLFEKTNLCRHSTVFSILFLFTCLRICFNSHVHLKNRSLLPFHKVFSIFIHTSTHLFQQSKCYIALVFARMHLFKF